MQARKDVKYAVYNKENFMIGRTKTLAAAEKLLKRKDAKMIASLKKSDHSFSGYTIKKVIKRK